MACGYMSDPGAPSMAACVVLVMYAGCSACALGVVVIDLHQLRVINMASKGVRNHHRSRIRICVHHQLDSIHRPVHNILQKMRRRASVPRSNKPANGQLRIGIDSGEDPNVTSVAAVVENGAASHLALTKQKLQNLVDLYALGWNLPKRNVFVLGARFADRLQQAKDGSFGDASDPRGSANRATFNQGHDNCSFFAVLRMLAMTSLYCTRFSIVDKQTSKGCFFLAFLFHLAFAALAHFVGHWTLDMISRRTLPPNLPPRLPISAITCGAGMGHQPRQG